MSGLFGGGGAPAPPPLPPVPPPPVMPDTQSPQVLEAQQIQTAEALRRSGRRSTIFDSTVPTPPQPAYSQPTAGTGGPRV